MSIPDSTSSPSTTHAFPALDQATHEGRITATLRLAFAREQHTDLVRAEVLARLDLGAAIMAMDEAEDVPNRHNLVEQAAVETALRAYGQALANLVRGEAS